MSSSNYFRSWIDRPHLDPNTRLLTEEYQQGITEFMGLVHRQPEAKTGMLRCPCSNCKNKLVRELELGGPVQYRWMYLYERYMFHLKKMVKNMILLLIP